MSALDELDLPSFEYFDPELRGARFHEQMLALRDAGWLARTPLGIVVLDHEAAEFFLRTKSAIFPGAKIAELFDIHEGALYEQLRRNILCIDGEDHRRLRSLVNPALTARAVERYRPAMRKYVTELFEAVAGTGRCDFVAAIAKPYPSMMIATVMGAPLSDAERLHEWSNVIQRQFASNLFDERERIERAVEEFYGYVDGLIAARRADPGDDLVSKLIAAEEDGDRLSDVECVNLVLNVLIGGVDTSQAQLAQGIRLFAEHPDQWEALGQRPELVEPAVEEIIRYEPITPFTARILLEQVEYRGVTFPADTVILACAFTGNRDGTPETDRFDVEAHSGGARTLTFGAGIHYCLGANLARAELQEALGYLAPRMRELRLDGEPAFDTVHGIYGLDTLPVAFQAG
jgi:cytochrome P450